MRARKSQRLLLAVISFASLFLCLQYLLVNEVHIFKRLYMYIGYGTRWIWDNPPKPFTLISHSYHASFNTQDLCRLNGLTKVKTRRRVYDAIPFSIELDLLEIRLHELWPVVDTFVIIESNQTFTGKSKSWLFHENRERFKFAQDKIVYAQFYDTEGGADAWLREDRMRRFFDSVLLEAGIKQGDVLLMTDTDEIPFNHVVLMFSECKGMPQITHLQLRNYMYSFQWLVDMDSWRAQVHYYQPGQTRYQHDRRSDYMLVDSGWHCSFCFARIKDFVFKMTAYSHYDRIQSSAYLEQEWIRRAVCEGLEIFGFLPTSYTLFELLYKLEVPYQHITSEVDLPEYVLRNKQRFGYLLPNGNCTLLE
jgi:beta-1,4-mannosyl-glycoprotein beta-1,4-N-acetylglucosaminyltransferase